MRTTLILAALLATPALAQGAKPQPPKPTLITHPNGAKTPPPAPKRVPSGSKHKDNLTHVRGSAPVKPQ